MNPNRFFMPGYMGITNNIMNAHPIMRLPNNVLGNQIGRISNTSGATRGLGFFNKITSGIRSVNWGSFLNNANKTLNVVNQTIPLVRQAGPMVNNMKSMIKIAKVFGNETNNIKSNKKNLYNHNNIYNNGSDLNNNSNNVLSDINNISTTNNLKYIDNEDNEVNQKKIQNNNSPNFFV